MDDTSRIANALKRQGVKKGDRVCIYMPVSPIGVASMLACARIGAVHRFVFLLSCTFVAFSLAFPEDRGYSQPPCKPHTK